MSTLVISVPPRNIKCMDKQGKNPDKSSNLLHQVSQQAAPAI
jgi:hypothetical protein